MALPIYCELTEPFTYRLAMACDGHHNWYFRSHIARFPGLSSSPLHEKILGDNTFIDIGTGGCEQLFEQHRDMALLYTSVLMFYLSLNHALYDSSPQVFGCLHLSQNT